MNDHVVDYRASYLAARRAIIQARNRLAKGRALWNGPTRECDSVLAAFLYGPIVHDDPRDAQIAALEQQLATVSSELDCLNDLVGALRGLIAALRETLEMFRLAATEPKP